MILMVFHMNLICQLRKKNKKKTIFMKFKINLKENNRDKQKSQKRKQKRYNKINKNANFIFFLLSVISLIYKMEKGLSNKIQLGDTLNPLKDYSGVPSINDEGNLENLFQKVDKVGEFWKTGKADGD